MNTETLGCWMTQEQPILVGAAWRGLLGSAGLPVVTRPVKVYPV